MEHNWLEASVALPPLLKHLCAFFLADCRLKDFPVFLIYPPQFVEVRPNINGKSSSDRRTETRCLQHCLVIFGTLP